MKNYGDLRVCYPPRPTASKDNTLLDLHNLFLGFFWWAQITSLNLVLL